MPAPVRRAAGIPHAASPAPGLISGRVVPADWIGAHVGAAAAVAERDALGTSVRSTASGLVHQLSDGLAEAIRVALTAARWTRGVTDPTVGAALIALGYDRDFAAIGVGTRPPPAGPGPVPGWRSVTLDSNAAATAAIVAGTDAETFLAGTAWVSGRGARCTGWPISAGRRP